MAPRLSRLHLHSIDGAHSQPGALRRVLQFLSDIAATGRQAWAAADHYEDLKSMSDRALADIGLERKDIPRAAFDRLTRED
jgi:uncharacterized protein YjiS (DUF1127 family)